MEEPVQEEFGRFVAIILHTDGRDEEYRESSLRNARLQRERFNQRALPYYVLLDPTGTKVYAHRGGVFSVPELIDFLQKAP
jgi:hypothetical protein